MSGHNIIAVGASRGGVEALMTVAGGLPVDLPAAVFVVLHLSPHSRSLLSAILNRAGPLPAVHAVDGQAIKPGRIYVAPPDHHLLINDGHARVVRGPKENRTRPAVDPLFRSAAQHHGPHVVGVVLTGGQDDGTAGLREIKAQGGMAVVQDPETAISPSMPRSALAHVKVDYCLPLSEIAPLLVRLACDPVEEVFARPVSDQAKRPLKPEEVNTTMAESHGKAGSVSVFTCPECHSTLWEQQDGGLLRFQCRVGHAFSAGNPLAEQSEAIEQTLWAALSRIEERAALTHRLASLERGHGQPELSSAYEEKGRDAQQYAALLRQVLTEDGEWYSTADL